MNYVLLDDSKRHIVQQFGEVSQLIDGTIVGNEFVDKSGNGYNLDIINNDIESGFGFPYKCAAMVAQKAANYGKVSDVNNFWFDSGGTPNQIPVVSLFQNIDYANQIFTKHQAQGLNSNSEEVVEPMVTMIVTYKTPLVSSVIEASTYFEVPAEVTSNVYWVDFVNGLDANAGTKAAPWKTLSKANTGTSNKTIYVKTGNYTEASTLTLLTGQTWNFIGYCPFVSAAAAIFISGTNSCTINGAIITPAAGSRALYFISGNNNTANRCKLNVNGANSKNFQILAGTGNMLKYCLLYNNQNTPSIDLRAVGMTIYGCYFSGTQTGVSEIVSFNTTTITGNVDFFYNKCASGLVANHGFFLFNVAATNFNIKYNYFKTTGGIRLCVHLDSAALTGGYNWYYNTIKPTGLTNSFMYIAASNALTVDIQHNKIYITDSLVEYIIYILGQATPKVNYNYIYTSVENDAIQIASQTAKGAAEIKYNTIHQPADGGSITLGSDANNTWDNGHNGSQIIGNSIYGLWYYSPNSVTNVGHGIAVFNCIDVHVKYNYANGTNHLVVYKASDRVTAMANTDAVCSYNVGINNDGSLFPKTMSGIKFYNNTTYADNANIQGMAGGVYVLASSGAATNNVFKNNLFIDRTPLRAGVVVIEIGQPGSLSGFVSDYNIVYSENNKIADISSTEYTWAGWQGLGYDANSTNATLSQADNMFADSTNYKPTETAISHTGGEDLGATYRDGLHINSDFYNGYTNYSPYVETYLQLTDWHRGAWLDDTVTPI